MLEAKPLDLLYVMSTNVCEHLLYALGQAIGPSVLHDLELDRCGGGVSHLATEAGCDKPLKFPFRVIMKPTAHELQKQAVKVKSQGSEVALKDEVSIMP
jgi:hypothetical protein